MKNDWSNQTGSLICQVIEIHPWLDRLWLHLAQWYRTRNDLEKEYWCLEKASQTESSQNIANIQNLMDDNTLDSELKEQIRLKILQNISVPKQVRKVEQVDFVDLGSSVQIREQEEKMKNINTSFEDSECLIRMFENKWFSIWASYRNFFFTEINMSDDEREIDNDLDSEVNKFLLRRFFYSSSSNKT